MLLKSSIEIYQWLVPLLAIYFLYRIWLQYKSNGRIFIGSIIWVIFWIVISCLAIFPDLVSFSIADLLGFKDHINAVIFVGIGFLFVLSYYQSQTIQLLERQVTELVRQIALDKQEREDKKLEAEYEKSKSEVHLHKEA